MHAFDINVWPLLNTHSGERIHFEFEDEVLESEWEDLVIQGKLIFAIDIIAIEDGVDVIIKNCSCTALYEGNSYHVKIPAVERTFVKNYSTSLPDDINPINLKHASINLGKVLREEILMQIL